MGRSCLRETHLSRKLAWPFLLLVGPRALELKFAYAARLRSYLPPLVLRIDGSHPCPTHNADHANVFMIDTPKPTLRGLRLASNGAEVHITCYRNKNRSG